MGDLRLLFQNHEQQLSKGGCEVRILTKEMRAQRTAMSVKVDRQHNENPPAGDLQSFPHFQQVLLKMIEQPAEAD